jgi:hypothetical protein
MMTTNNFTTRVEHAYKIFIYLRFQYLTAASINITAFWGKRPGTSVEVDDVSEVHTAFIIRVMVVAVGTSETSVYLNETTWRCIPGNCYLVFI